MRLCGQPTHYVAHGALSLAMVVLRHMPLCEIAGLVWRSKSLSDDAFRKDFGDPVSAALFIPLRFARPAAGPSDETHT